MIDQDLLGTRVGARYKSLAREMEIGLASGVSGLARRGDLVNS